MSRSKTLITGISGMVGSHLADYLLEHTDWDVYGMCRWRSPLDNVKHLLDRVNRRDRVFFVYGDLRDYISIQNVVEQAKPDYVFHLAAQSYPMTSFTSPLDTYDTNIEGTARLLEALRRFPGIDPMIHVCSSSEVYGRVSKEKLPIGEECAFRPASPYAISKVGTVFAESTFAKQIAMAEKNLIPPVIKVGNLESLRTWSDVRDAVRAYHMLVTIKPVPGEYYNIGGAHFCTVGDMLRHLLSLSTRKDIKVEADPGRLRPIDADLQIPDTSKFTKHTGWTPEIPFEKTMRDLLDYWRQRVRSGEVFLTR